MSASSARLPRIGVGQDDGRAGAPLTIRTSHARMAARRTPGGGTPLVLLHGASSSNGEFAGLLAPPFGLDRAMVAVDLPGHGGSGPAHDPDATYTLDGYADAVIEVLEHLGIEEVCVLGRSLGAQVGLRMAGAYPAFAGLLVLRDGQGEGSRGPGREQAPAAEAPTASPRIVSRADERYRRIPDADRAPSAAELAAAGLGFDGGRPIEDLAADHGWPSGAGEAPAGLRAFLERVDRIAPDIALGLCLSG